MKSSDSQPPRRPRQRLLIAFVLATVAGGVLYWQRAAVQLSAQKLTHGDTGAAGKTAGTRPGDKGRPAGPRAPVHVTVVETADFPVTLTGLGTVQAFNSVLVKSRVDGQVETVAREEGQSVKAGDLLVKLDAAPFKAALNLALAKSAQDEASLKNAKQDLERTQDLVARKYATPQLLDQRVALVATLTAQLQADAASIEAAKVQLAYTNIKAPIAGVAGFRQVDAGNIVRATDATGVMTINQLQPISVVFTAPEKELPAIVAAKAAGPLEVLAYSSDGKTLLGSGRLTLFDNQIDQASGTIKLKATFANDDRKLWPGLSVVARLRVGVLKNVIVVPDSVVQRSPKGLFAYVASADDRAEPRPLKVGLIANNSAVIEDGLAVGERAITSGHSRVQPGTPLEILADAGKPAQQAAQGE